MAKLSSSTTALRPAPKVKPRGGRSPIQSKKRKTEITPAGESSVLKAKSELFLTAISTFAGEGTFYEGGDTRIDRVRELTQLVTENDPDWLQRFIPWLRGPDANIRTISLIIAAEYVAAGGPNGRKVINSVCQRADEPAEILAYWMQNYYGWDTKTYPLPSPKLPQALRKGLADAVLRLYNEYSAMKYDGGSRGVSMANVLNLVHAKPADDHDRAIWQFIMDSSYGNEPEVSELPMIKRNLKLRKKSRAKLLGSLDPEKLKAAGVTWEQLGGMLSGPWTAGAWEAMIPNMGYMALLRNLRNFEGAGISQQAQDYVIAKLSDPQEVEKSRQLPFRFLSAYKSINSDTYTRAIGRALDLSVQNIPAFDGRTLVLVDKSGSMDRTLSKPGQKRTDYYGGGNDPTQPRLWEVGALFAVALALKAGKCDLAIFGTTSKLIPLPKGGSVLKTMRLLDGNQGVQHGTNIWGSVRDQYHGHDRVVIFTDVHDNGHGAASDLQAIPFIHTFDIGGTGQTPPLSVGSVGRYQYGGFSDATFKLMALLEHSDGAWPF